jgi:cyclase
MSQTIRVIPCLDLKDGRVVKGVRFVELRDAGDPVAAAAAYGEAGADELFLLDISAANADPATRTDLIRRTRAAAGIPLNVGGGVSSPADIDRLLQAGADRVSIGSAAVHDPGFVADAARQFGSERIIIAIDAKRSAGREPRWEVFTNGGRTASGLDAVTYARQLASLGAGELLLTSMDCDGTRDGFDLQLTRAVADATPLPVIASGGAGSPEHFTQGVTQGHASALLAASVFHFGTLTVPAVKQHLHAAGIQVRLPG